MLAALLLAGCSTIDYRAQPPVDFPRLAVRTHQVDADTLRLHCKVRPWNPVFGGALACTIPDFRAGVCNIYLLSTAAWLIEHETAHCRGYDHPGETTIRDMWLEFKKQPDAEAWLRFRNLK